jgi:hypothetical protein
MSESSVAQPLALSVDDVQFHVKKVKALARELWDLVEPVETVERVTVGAPGYDSWYTEWDERSALVDMMQQCIIEHLEQIEDEVLSLRSPEAVAA